MITRLDIETEVQTRAMSANNSTMLPTGRLTKIVQDAYLWAGTLYFWPPLYRARKFSSKPNTQSLNYDYYDYPVDFLTNSISRLYIGGKKYDKKAFQDFLDYVDNAIQDGTPPDQTKRYFAEFSRQFFVYPTVSSAGSSDGIVWGNIQPLQLGSPSDNTIFSLWDDAGNEAICKKALSVAMERLDAGFAAQQKKEAIDLLGLIWRKITTELQKSQRLNHPFFQTFDMIGQQSGMSTIGNFNAVSTVY
jgi:hypothetical protein